MKKLKFPYIVKEHNVSVPIRKSSQIQAGKKYPLFIVDYYLLGKRKREARATFEQALEVAKTACQTIAAGRQVSLTLTGGELDTYRLAKKAAAPLGVPLDEAVRNYADALQILCGKASVAEACREWVRRNAVALPKITVADAAKLFNAESESQRSQLRRKALAWTMTHLETAFGTVGVDTLTPDLISRHLAALKMAERTKKNHRDSIGFFNRWLILRGYLSKGTDWLEHVQDYSSRKLSEIEIYSPAEVTRLLLQAGKMTPFIAIAAFGGLRHAELARLDWREIDLEDGFIEVLATKSKTGERRLVPIHGNLKKWLQAHRPQSGNGKVVPYANTTKQLLKIAREAGVTWKHNGLRHSFISYRVAECADVPRVSDEAGNSPAMIRQHYLRRVKPAQGAEWFSIVPPETSPGTTAPATLPPVVAETTAALAA